MDCHWKTWFLQIQTYLDLLDTELKPKGNKLLSIIELWTQSKQASRTLNEWLTYIYSLVELCDYGDSKDRIIRDALIIECNKIVQKGEKIKLNEVIEILQIEDSTRQTLKEMNSNVQKINYVSYEKKKSKGTKKQQKLTLENQSINIAPKYCISA